jgi:hypothetical protein
MARNFVEDLKIQTDFLKASCEAFDGGNETEGIRIAQTLRILLHNTNRSTSLFSRLKIRHLFSTAPKGIIAPGDSKVFGLVGFTSKLSLTSLEGLCEPLFKLNERNLGTQNSYKNKNVPIKEWWENEIVFYWPDLLMTRKKLVTITANKEGGAHVDDIVDPEFESLKTSSLKIEIDLKNGTKLQCAYKNIHLAALRQMGHEILSSKEVTSLIA